MKHYFLFLIAWLSLSLSVAHAQHHAFSGRVTDTQRQPLVGVRVLLSRGDSLMAACLTDAKGRFALSDLPADTFRLQMIFPGFTTIEEACPLTHDLHTTFVMNEEMTGRLDEVTVTASASGVVRRTATGEVFRLSDSARASGDPYRALREIPRLAVNESLQTVSMIDGSQLLVLIDGRMVNSGITPIDPKDIETVELIDAVGARYVQMGVRHILNIRLKKKRDPYLFFEAATRHDIPRRHSFGVVYFEVGNPKASLYGRAVAEGHASRRQPHRLPPERREVPQDLRRPNAQQRWLPDWRTALQMEHVAAGLLGAACLRVEEAQDFRVEWAGGATYEHARRLHV